MSKMLNCWGSHSLQFNFDIYFRRAELCQEVTSLSIPYSLSIANMKISQIFIFVCFVCFCQAHVAAPRPHPLSVVRRQADKSQKGGGTTAQQPNPEQDKSSQQEPSQQKQSAAQPDPEKPSQQDTTQQKQPVTQPDQVKPSQQDTAQGKSQQQQPAPGQGTPEQSTGQQRPRPQAQNGQAADNTQQNAGDQSLKSSNKQQDVPQNNAAPAQQPTTRLPVPQQTQRAGQPSEQQQDQQQNAGDSGSENWQSQGRQPQNQQAKTQ